MAGSGRGFLPRVLEVRVALPQSTVHATVEDDVYNGYFIPKGECSSEAK